MLAEDTLRLHAPFPVLLAEHLFLIDESLLCSSLPCVLAAFFLSSHFFRVSRCAYRGPGVYK